MQTQASRPRLSICIPTYNRAAQIGETLDSIISQLTEQCEIVISDNASTDNTKDVIDEYARRCGQIRHFRQCSNIGSDRNYDYVVQQARGQYCWLMSDDDVLKPFAITSVLDAIENGFSLVLCNYERRDLDMGTVLLSRAAELQSNKVYPPSDLDRLVEDAGQVLYFAGAVVIERAAWMARDRERYYGSMWIHLGVTLQEHFTGKMLLIAKPLISYRDGNSKSYSSDFMEVCTIKLAAVVSTLRISKRAKNGICNLATPWRNNWTLLLYRAAGCYSPSEYRRLVRPRVTSALHLILPAAISKLPGVLVNILCVLGTSLGRDRFFRVTLVWLKNSPFYYRNLLKLENRRASAVASGNDKRKSAIERC